MQVTEKTRQITEQLKIDSKKSKPEDETFWLFGIETAYKRWEKTIANLRKHSVVLCELTEQILLYLTREKNLNESFQMKCLTRIYKSRHPTKQRKSAKAIYPIHHRKRDSKENRLSILCICCNIFFRWKEKSFFCNNSLPSFTIVSLSIDFGCCNVCLLRCQFSSKILKINIQFGIYIIDPSWIDTWHYEFCADLQHSHQMWVFVISERQKSSLIFPQFAFAHLYTRKTTFGTPNKQKKNFCSLETYSWFGRRRSNNNKNFFRNEKSNISISFYRGIRVTENWQFCRCRFSSKIPKFDSKRAARNWELFSRYNY